MEERVQIAKRRCTQCSHEFEAEQRIEIHAQRQVTVSGGYPACPLCGSRDGATLNTEVIAPA
jgi:DNA-directed RNA polymerase subunit RPC12/RpoP